MAVHHPGSLDFVVASAGVLDFSREKFLMSSSLVQISCSVPSFQPRQAGNSSIPSGSDAIGAVIFMADLAPSRLPEFLLPVGARMCGSENEFPDFEKISAS